jgi:hypothetical protein
LSRLRAHPLQMHQPPWQRPLLLHQQLLLLLATASASQLCSRRRVPKLRHRQALPLM